LKHYNFEILIDLFYRVLTYVKEAENCVEEWLGYYSLAEEI